MKCGIFQKMLNIINRNKKNQKKFLKHEEDKGDEAEKANEVEGGDDEGAASEEIEDGDNEEEVANDDAEAVAPKKNGIEDCDNQNNKAKKTNMPAGIWKFGFDKSVKNVVVCHNTSCGLKFYRTQMTSYGSLDFDRGAMAKHLIAKHDFTANLRINGQVLMKSLKPPPCYQMVPTNSIHNSSLNNSFVDDKFPCIFCGRKVNNFHFSRHFRDHGNNRATCPAKKDFYEFGHSKLATQVLNGENAFAALSLKNFTQWIQDPEKKDKVYEVKTISKFKKFENR